MADHKLGCECIMLFTVHYITCSLLLQWIDTKSKCRSVQSYSAMETILYSARHVYLLHSFQPLLLQVVCYDAHQKPFHQIFDFASLQNLFCQQIFYASLAILSYWTWSSSIQIFPACTYLVPERVKKIINNFAHFHT